MTPLAGTGTRFGLYLKEMCSNGRPRIAVLDLYSNPHPSHFSFQGCGAPQLGQAIACSEIWCWHSLQGFICLPQRHAHWGLADDARRAVRPEAVPADRERNNQRCDDPHGLRHEQDERNIDEAFAVHGAGKAARDQEWTIKKRWNPQGEYDWLRNEIPPSEA